MEATSTAPSASEWAKQRRERGTQHRNPFPFRKRLHHRTATFTACSDAIHDDCRPTKFFALLHHVHQSRTMA